MRRGAAPRLRRSRRRHLQRARGRGERRRLEGRRRVLRLGARARRASFRRPRLHHPYNNRTIYGAAKAFNEGLLRSFAEMYGLKYVALRYFNVYGPRMDVYGVYTEVLIRWMERIAAGQPPLIFGDGTQTMDFVARPRHRPRQHPRREGRRHRRGLQRRERNRDEPARARADARLRHGLVAEAAIRAGPQGEPVPRRLADVEQGARACSASRPRSRMEEGLRDLVAWWRA